MKDHSLISFEFERADMLLTTGKITEEIDERVRNADLVVADITEDNPNVFYELGLAHAAGETAILLKQRIEGEPLEIPFDIKNFRVHTYKFSPDGFADLKDKLPRIITNVLT